MGADSIIAISLCIIKLAVCVGIRPRYCCAVAPGETTIGYCSLLQIESVSDYAGPPGPWLSSIQFKSVYELHTLNTTETLRDKIRQGEQVRHHYI